MLRRWQHIGVGMIIGAMVALAAAYFFSRPIIQMFAHSPFQAAASEGTLDVAVLRRLRSGDTPGAIEIMERRLEMNELTLSSYEDPAKVVVEDPSVRRAMEVIAEYRAANPSPKPSNTSLERGRDR